MLVRPIGVIRTPFTKREAVPHQPVFSRCRGRIEVAEKYAPGLRDIEGFSHLAILFQFNRSRGYKLCVKPFRDSVERGVFSCRAPWRPNRIGLSVVRLIRRRKNILYVQGVDMLDKTPLLDIKPYVPQFDPRGPVRIGWLAGKVPRKR